MIFFRNYLIFQLNNNVIFLLLIIFVDKFEVYRNMYRFFTNVYVVSAKFSFFEKQKNFNSYIITFESHESKFNNIMNCFRINIKITNRNWTIDFRNEKKLREH